jgi:hypothetical protein
MASASPINCNGRSRDELERPFLLDVLDKNTVAVSGDYTAPAFRFNPNVNIAPADLDLRTGRRSAPHSGVGFADV